MFTPYRNDFTEATDMDHERSRMRHRSVVLLLLLTSGLPIMTTGRLLADQPAQVSLCSIDRWNTDRQLAAIDAGCCGRRTSLVDDSGCAARAFDGEAEQVHNAC